MHMCARSQAIEGLIEPHVCIHIYNSMHENKEIKSQPKGTKPSLQSESDTKIDVKARMLRQPQNIQ